MMFNKDLRHSRMIFKLLIEKGAEVNVKNDDLWTPLHLAVKRDQTDAVEEIIKYNKSVSEAKQFSINRHGGAERVSALHLAVQHMNDIILQLLLQNGSNLYSHNLYNKTLHQISMKDNFVAKMLKIQEKKYF